MSKRGGQVPEEALSLPAGEKAKLIDRLLPSLDSPSPQGIDVLWAQEAEENVSMHLNRGEIKAIFS